MVFGRESKRERMFVQKSSYDRAIYNKYIFDGEKYGAIINEQLKAVKDKIRLTESSCMDDIAYLHINSGNWLTSNNTIERFIDGKSKFRSLIKDIKQAKCYIHMEYYIIRDDSLGKVIVEELTKKAKEGLEVKLLFDGMGCHSLSKGFFNELILSGGRVEAFLPPLFARINYRNHRKICIVDGEVGYIGGFNIGDEYLGVVERYGPWRDTHLKIKGNAIDQLQVRFINDWNFTAKDRVSFDCVHFPKRKDKNGIKMQIVSSGPDTDRRNIRDGYFKMMNEAQKNIYIETPYFVPDDSIFEALKVAARSGIDVRIVIPAHPDHYFVYWASMSYLGELLESGIRCYQYEKGFIHSKALFVDGIGASVGTANMDIRSFDLNFEVNAFIYDSKFVSYLEADFLNDLQDCTEITVQWYELRSAWFKTKESVARLISPML